jgi:hypothetical protein
MNDQDLKSLWKSQSVESGDFSLKQLQRDASTFERMINRRNRIEYAACLLVALIFGTYGWFSPENAVMQAGCALMVLGAFVIMVQLHRHASIKAAPGADLALPYVAYLRQELERQRDALRSVWLWYIGPIVPGLAVFVWGLAHENPAQFPWVITLLFIGPTLAVIAMNFHAAQKLQQKIDQLNSAGL